MQKTKSRIEVRCTRSLSDRLDAFAAKNAITKSDLIRQAVIAYMEAKQAKTPTA
jgi:metal-responsive CopG/Arc/MetJ family transcriptional regulator